MMHFECITRVSAPKFAFNIVSKLNYHTLPSKTYHGSDGCLATGEGTTEKIPEFQVGIEPTTFVRPVGYYNH